MMFRGIVGEKHLHNMNYEFAITGLINWGSRKTAFALQNEIQSRGNSETRNLIISHRVSLNNNCVYAPVRAACLCLGAAAEIQWLVGESHRTGYENF